MSHEGDDPILDAGVTAQFAGLFDAGELRDVVEEWRADGEAALRAVDAAVAGGDLGRVGEIAHRTAGGGLALGAARLARACERLRAAAEAGTHVTAADVAPLREAFELTHAALVDMAARRAG